MGHYTGLRRASSTSSGTTLPTSTSRGGRGRRRQQTGLCSTNVRLTILCGVITILVFRGTIGISLIAPYPETATYAHAEETDRIIAEIRSDANDYDDVDPDQSITTSSNGTYSLGPKIINWDNSRNKWLRENRGFPNIVKGKPRIWLVTASPPGPCDHAVSDHFLLKSIKNKIDYCRTHGIEIMYNMVHLDKQLTGYWAKLPLIRKLMVSHPEVEWIWWMDNDAFFTDMSFDIPISKYHRHNLVVHGYPNLVFDKKSWISLSTGSFLIRNCQWSLDLLDSWAQMGLRGRVREHAGMILTANLKDRPEFEADDQSALIYLLISRKDELMDKVFLENSYYLHGHWVGIVDRYEEYIQRQKPGFGDDRWPFVTHFVGCKPCGGSRDHSLERCLTSMQKAFNFADDQILNKFGFSHRGLLSPNVKRIRNETDSSLVNIERIRNETDRSSKVKTDRRKSETDRSSEVKPDRRKSETDRSSEVKPDKRKSEKDRSSEVKTDRRNSSRRRGKGRGRGRGRGSQKHH